MSGRRVALGVVAVGCVVALGLTGGGEPRCTPMPVEPFCESDADCGPGEFCRADGSACESFQACAADDECVMVDADCCGCSSGGRSTAVNGAWEAEWYEHLACPPTYACLDVYLCDGSVPACVDGACRLVAPPADDCAADADCGEGGFCRDGRCESWTACASDDECVEVPAGCCPCSMGGRSTAVNARWAGLWQAHLDCSPNIACLAVYLCQDWAPACVAGHCALEGGGVMFEPVR